MSKSKAKLKDINNIIESFRNTKKLLKQRQHHKLADYYKLKIDLLLTERKELLKSPGKTQKLKIK